MEHEFTLQIKQILQSRFGAAADDLYERSLLLQYLNVSKILSLDCLHLM